MYDVARGSRRKRCLRKSNNRERYTGGWLPVCLKGGGCDGLKTEAGIQTGHRPLATQRNQIVP